MEFLFFDKLASCLLQSITLSITMLPLELESIILKYVNFLTLERIASTNKSYLPRVQEHLIRHPKQINHLLVLLRLFPSQPWDARFVSRNPNITWDIVCDHPFPWDYQWLSYNPNITYALTQAHPDHDWCYQGLVYYDPAVTWDMVQADPCKWGSYANSPNFTFDIVKAHPLLPWKHRVVNKHPNITWDIVMSHKGDLNCPNDHRLCIEYGGPRKFPPLRNIWCYHEYSSNPNLTWDIVQAHPDKEFDMAQLSYHPNITWDIIQAHPDKFVPRCVSYNPNITWEIVKAHPEYPWDISVLTRHPNITFDHMLNSSIKWDKAEFGSNPNLTWNIVRDNPDFQWNWKKISANEFNWVR